MCAHGIAQRAVASIGTALSRMAHKGVWEGVGKLATRLEVLAAGERSASVPIYRFIWQLATSFAEICTEVVKHV